MRITRLRAFFIALVLLLVIFEVLQLLRLFDVQSIFANIAFVLVGIIFVALMSVIGGFFLGMWISARFFTTKGFTPFEEEMMRMREEVKEMRARLERMDGGSRPGDPVPEAVARLQSGRPLGASQPAPSPLGSLPTEANGGRDGSSGGN